MGARSGDVFLGVDLGTSAVKVIAVDEAGALLADARAPLQLIAKSPLQAEQDADAWWTAARDAIRTVVEALPARKRITAVGLTGQKHALLPLDSTDVPLHPALLWADGRARDEAEELRLVFPAIRRRTGYHALPGFLVPKWLRFVRSDPQWKDLVTRICFAKDWIRLKLTGEHATDRTEASVSQVYDFRANDWLDDLVRLFELPEDMAPVHASTRQAGAISPRAERETGIPAGTPVAAGAGDNEAAALACGAIGEGRVAVVLGTSGTVIGWNRLRQPAGGLVWNRHVIPTGYAATGTVLSAGRALEWARRTFFPDGTRMTEVLAAAEQSNPGRAPLVCLPGFVGERSPVADPYATGAFVGLRPLHRRGHLARAVVEGVALSIAEILVLMRGAGISVRELRLISGGAASPFWRRQIAAAAGVPVRLVALRRGPAVGAAVLAAAMTGRHGRSTEIAERWVRPGPIEAPDADEQARLAPLGTTLRAVRNALRGVNTRGT